MKKKQFMSKLAALTMAAAMGLTAVPATTVFAQTVAVDESNITINGATTISSYTVDGEASSDLASTDVRKTIGDKINGAILTSDDTTDKAKATLQAAVDQLTASGQALANHTITVVSTTLTNANGNGNVVVDYDDGSQYTYTFTVLSAVDNTANEKDALDDLFSNISAITYDGKSINTAVVQTALNTALAKAQNHENASTDSAAVKFFGKTGTEAAGAGNAYKYTVQSATVSGDTVTGTIVRSSDGSAISSSKPAAKYYTYSAKAVQNSESARDAVSEAIAEIQQNKYPSVAADYNTSTDTEGLIKKITADLNDALDGKATANITDITIDPATATSDGTLTCKINTKLVALTLKYSSKNKMSASDTAITKTALKGLTGTATEKSVKADGTVDTSDTDANTYTFASTSDFSRSIQPRNSEDAVDAEAVRAAVEKKITDATKDVSSDVTYKVETVTKYSLDGSTIKDLPEKAKYNAEGTYVVKVTATTANDFYGYTDDENKTQDTNVYYVVVKTPELKSIKPTSVDVEDQTVVRKNNAYTTAAKGPNGDAADASVITVKANTTPANANTGLTWEILDEDGHAVTQTATYGKDGKALTLGSGTFLVTKAGKYTINVKSTLDNTVKDTMTLTVKDSFNDVNSTAYYGKAVENAYSLGVTSGVSSSEFGVNQDVTRGQFITWLYNYAVARNEDVVIKDDDVNVNSTFSDVANTAYYAKAVQWAYANKYAAGTGNGKFSPEKKISRAQAITLIYNTLGKPQTGATGSEGESTTQFTDLKDGAYYVSAVTWGVNTYSYQKNAGGQVINSTPVVSGTSTTKFNPDATATRAQAISFIARAYGFYY